MINNPIYKNSLEKNVTEISIKDGNILVTGATGLIGSCLIDLLMIANRNGRSFNVYALGRNIEKLKDRFKAFTNSKHLHFIEQDIQNALNNKYIFDYIIHGASNADPRKYLLYPVETMLINMEGAKNVLNYCKIHQEVRAIMLSSFEVYGNANKDYYYETDFGMINQNNIRSCYPESKRCMELLTRCYVEEYGVKAIIGRLCSIYGPTMEKDDSKAHAQFIKNALRGENIVLKSRGDQKRTYCYVMDAVTGLLYALEKGKIGEVYNISNEKSIVSIAEVAEAVAIIAGTKVVYECPDEIENKSFLCSQNCILDNTKLKSLGWCGKYSLTQGLNESISILKYNNG